MVWAFVVVVLGVLALVLGVVLSLTTGISLGMALAFALGLFVVETLTFLVGVWLAAWMNGSRFSRTRLVHQDKLLRRENHKLQRTVEAQQRRIEALEHDLAAIRTQTASVPTTRTTGALPRVETREVQRTTGEYRLVNTPTYTPRGDTEPIRTTRETGVYQPVKETGTHPIRRTGRVPRPRNLTDDSGAT
jgi:hypothetical protein